MGKRIVIVLSEWSWGEELIGPLEVLEQGLRPWGYHTDDA